MKFVAIAMLFFATSARADFEFSKHGTAHPTTAADGALVIGQEALNLISHLNGHTIRQQGFVQTILSLDGSYPAQGALIACSVEDTKDQLARLKSAECYIGNAPKAK